MTKFQEKNPSNARILINHKKKSVKFSYPNKHHPFTIIYATSTMIWFLLNFTILISYALISWIINIIKNPAITTNTLCTTTTNFAGIGMDLRVWGYGIIGLEWMLVPPILFTLIVMDKDWFIKNMPKINMYLSLFPWGRYYQKEITSLNKKVFEIPMLDNTFLDYEPSGEFEDYLEEVKIIEHDLDYCRASVFSKKIKKTRNEFHWTARFIFSKIPKKGMLRIKFK